MHRPMHLRYLKAVKFLALAPAQGLISLDILCSTCRWQIVVAESSGEEATADKSAQVIKLVLSVFPRSI